MSGNTLTKKGLSCSAVTDEAFLSSSQPTVITTTTYTQLLIHTSASPVESDGDGAVREQQRAKEVSKGPTSERRGDR